VNSYEQLAKQANRFGIAAEDQWLLVGSTKKEIIDLAEKLNIDLIIVGAHDHHGLAMLFSSTANSIIHAMPCDVLAIHEEKS